MTKPTLIALLLENEPGNLSRVIGLFAQRNFNIESLSVSPTTDPSLSRVHITTLQRGPAFVEQISKQLYKLVPVYKLTILSEEDHVKRELALVKFRTATQQEKAEVQFVLHAYKADIVDTSKNHTTASIVASPSAIDNCLATISNKVVEVARTGAIGLGRKDTLL